jgi:hypothetical protein
MATFFVKSDGRALLPSSKAAMLEIEALPRGVPLKVEPKQPRNSKQHRLFFAFASYVADALNDGPTMREWRSEDVVTHLKLATGHVTTMRLGRADRERLGVGYAAVPASISFAAMDGVAFSDFMDRAMTYVRDELCQWIEDSDHWPDIEAVLIESGMLRGAA